MRVEGSFATHVRAPVGAVPRASTLASAVRALAREFSALELARDALDGAGGHVSLSRPFACGRDAWDGLIAGAARALRETRAVVVTFDALRVFVNEDGTRAFVAAGFRTGAEREDKRALVEMIERVNDAMESLGFPRYHDDPDPHVSLLSASRPSEELLSALRRRVEEMEPGEWRVEVNRVLIDISGQPPRTVWGRVALPAPDL